MLPDYVNLLTQENLNAWRDQKVYGPMTRGGGGLQKNPSLSTFDSNGAVITVEWAKIVSDVGLGPNPLGASETAYLLPPNGNIIYPQINPLQAAGSVVAEIVFDSPLAFINAASGQQPSPDAWAVVLNFKNGNASDDSRDYRLGAHCQFKSGALNFRSDGDTNPDPNNITSQAIVGTGLYTQYSNTTFKLTVQLDRTATTGLLTATLTILNAPPGSTPPTPFSFKIPSLGEIADATTRLTAVGFTVVNQVQGFKWVEGQGYVGDAHDVQVHITSFSLNP
jgi:hypothetical protein